MTGGNWRDIHRHRHLGKSMRPVVTDETSVFVKRDQSMRKVFEHIYGGKKMVTIQCVGAKLQRGSELASGMDLQASEPARIHPGQSQLVKTGLKIAVPKHYEAQVRSRSGLALKKSIIVLNAPGTIDADYRGEVGVILHNLGEYPFDVAVGDRIAQLVIAPVCHDVAFEIVTDLGETKRGEGGFGSTGVGQAGEELKVFVVNDPTTCPSEYLVVALSPEGAEEKYRSKMAVECNKLSVCTWGSYILKAYQLAKEHFRELLTKDPNIILTLEEVWDGVTQVPDAFDAAVAQDNAATHVYDCVDCNTPLGPDQMDLSVVEKDGNRHGPLCESCFDPRSNESKECIRCGVAVDDSCPRVKYGDGSEEPYCRKCHAKTLNETKPSAGKPIDGDRS